MLPLFLYKNDSFRKEWELWILGCHKFPAGFLHSNAMADTAVLWPLEMARLSVFLRSRHLAQGVSAATCSSRWEIFDGQNFLTNKSPSYCGSLKSHTLTFFYLFGQPPLVVYPCGRRRHLVAPSKSRQYQFDRRAYEFARIENAEVLFSKFMVWW